jgi:hypothetical protein
LDIPDEIGQQLTRVKAHGAAAAQEWSGGDGFNPRRAKRDGFSVVNASYNTLFERI